MAASIRQRVRIPPRLLMNRDLIALIIARRRNALAVGKPCRVCIPPSRTIIYRVSNGLSLRAIVCLYFAIVHGKAPRLRPLTARVPVGIPMHRLNTEDGISGVSSHREDRAPTFLQREKDRSVYSKRFSSLNESKTRSISNRRKKIEGEELKKSISR